MMLALHDALAASRLKGNALEFLLPRLVDKLQTQFCRFADVGAGVGTTAVEYHRILEKRLNPGLLRRLAGERSPASITCYEPLPENFAELTRRLGAMPECDLREAAAWNANGTVEFSVPSRRTGDAETWGAGTSWEGSILPARKRRKHESVTVRTVRLEDDLPEAPDFVKLDLQGGEMAAIEGLGEMLSRVKLLYVETQLLKQEPTCQYLADHGFKVLFDQFQFAPARGQSDFPAQALRDFGIAIDRIFFAPGSGHPPVMWGHCRTGDDSLFTGYSFSAAARDQAHRLGISYLQADALCINGRYQDAILAELDGVI